MKPYMMTLLSTTLLHWFPRATSTRFKIKEPCKNRGKRTDRLSRQISAISCAGNVSKGREGGCGRESFAEHLLCRGSRSLGKL
ncbi:hypothetical protein BDZ85DRAFT_261549 [Elsinoe ampelina]|uniref:Secreted protein n=1 Tax=Elsinoe ampelina TaxID=302913 RepID=A0A6A6GCI0_9PEZI|nr:hypothetical protein BDZ85DRAFT_261549 [Elsinoe ampelina]